MYIWVEQAYFHSIFRIDEGELKKEFDKPLIGFTGLECSEKAQIRKALTEKVVSTICTLKDKFKMRKQ